MSIHTYIAGDGNKIQNVSHRYNAASTYAVHASNNATQIKFFTDDTNSSIGDDPNRTSQAKLYKAVQFGSSIAEVPWRCCYSFTNLQNVVFQGSKVTSIGGEAFAHCTSLSSVSLPSSTAQISASAFEQCTALTSVAFPASSVAVGDKAFCKCGLTSLSVNLGDSSGENVFASCASLKTAAVNGNLQAGMLQNCSSLANVQLLKTQASIPAKCFMGCTSLATLSASSWTSVTAVGDYAFANCTALSAASILSSTSASAIGSNVFSGTGVLSVVLPAAISAISQVNAMLLGGTSVNYIKFLGMDSAYIAAHLPEFTSFGSSAEDIKFVSSDGKTFKLGDDGAQIDQARAYVVSISLSYNIEDRPLRGMNANTQDFVSMVNQAYSDNPDLILGYARLNDQGVAGSTALGNKDNLNAAFDTAAASGAELLLFHFGDHGGSKTSKKDGYICIYGYNYPYSELFEQFRKFKYVFALFCCCHGNSTTAEFTPGENNTHALFWCAGRPSELTYNYNGHVFMTKLKNTFNPSYTWETQWNKISGTSHSGQVHPTMYNYNDFPVSDKVFRVGSM